MCKKTKTTKDAAPKAIRFGPIKVNPIRIEISPLVVSAETGRRISDAIADAIAAEKSGKTVDETLVEGMEQAKAVIDKFLPDNDKKEEQKSAPSTGSVTSDACTSVPVTAAPDQTQAEVHTKE